MAFPAVIWVGLGLLGAFSLQAGKTQRTTTSRVARGRSTGVEVSLGCDAFTIVDPDRVKVTFLKGYVAARSDDDRDPFRIAVRVMRGYSPQCFRGDTPATLETLEYFSGVLEDVIGELTADGLISEDQAAQYHFNLAPWFEGHRARLGG